VATVWRRARVTTGPDTAKVRFFQILHSAGKFWNCRLVNSGKFCIDDHWNYGKDAQRRHFKPPPHARSPEALPLPVAMRANIAGIGEAGGGGVGVFYRKSYRHYFSVLVGSALNGSGVSRFNNFAIHVDGFLQSAPKLLPCVSSDGACLWLLIAVQCPIEPLFEKTKNGVCLERVAVLQRFLRKSSLPTMQSDRWFFNGRNCRIELAEIYIYIYCRSRRGQHRRGNCHGISLSPCRCIL
jgi:hypothetical protein